MIQAFLRVFLFALLAAGSLSPSFAGPITHAPTGAVFPDQVAGFTRTRVEYFESRIPGLGFGYTYTVDAATFATVYVFKGPPHLSVPATLADSGMAGHRQEAVRAVHVAASIRKEAVRQISQQQTSILDTPAFFDVFALADASGSTRYTLLWLWVAEGHLWKVRVTAPSVDNMQQVKTFTEDVVRLQKASAAAPATSTSPLPVAGSKAATGEGKRKVQLAIGKFDSPHETAFWTAYGVSLAGWVSKHRHGDTAPEGPFLVTYEAELYAREKLIAIWKEMIAKQPRSFPYADAMLKVEAAGLLREYVWYHHRRADWGLPPAGLRLDEFLDWSRRNIPDHKPMTGARISFGPGVRAAETATTQ